MIFEFFCILIVFFLLFCSAYFAACETAFTAYSKPKMFSMSKDGNKKAKIILELQEEVELVISAILTCNTILNTLTSIFAANLCSRFFGANFVIYFSFIIAILIVLFAEVLPKMLAISKPEKLLIPSAYFIKYVFVALKPINKVIGYIAKKFIVLIRHDKPVAEDYESSLDELKGAIDLHKGQNVEDTQQEKEMLKSVLDLGSVHVSQIMVHRKNVTMFCADDDPKSLIEQIMNCPFTRIPLWSGDQDNIIGVLHVKDLLKHLEKNRDTNQLNISEIALKPWFIPENKDLLDQLQSFKRKHEHFALVVDEYGSFMGIVTLEDIIEEIVGDISDEHDVVTFSGSRKQEDGSYIVDGSVNIRDFNREIGSNFKSDIAATIAGFVINSIGIIPNVGQIFVLKDYKFRILKRHRNQITLLRIEQIYDEKQSS